MPFPGKPIAFCFAFLLILGNALPLCVAETETAESQECCRPASVGSHGAEGVAVFASRLFDTSDFPPRWYCGIWPADLGWLHILSDLIIFGSYFAIPCTLLYFARRRGDLPFHRLFPLFAGFILACGFGHLLDAVIFWWPIYRFAGLVKAMTAVVSLVTAFVLVRLMPKILEAPSTASLAEELRETVQRFDCAAAAAQIGVWEWSLQDNRLHWDERLAKLFDLKPERNPTQIEVFLSHLHNEDRPQIEAALQKTIRDGSPYDVRYRILLDNGEMRHIAAHGQLIYNDRNEPERITGVCVDRTRERLHEEALAASEERYRVTFEQAAMGIAHLSPDGGWLRVNQGLCDIVGYTADELMSLCFQDITHPDDLATDLDQVCRILAGDISRYSLEKRYIHKHGHVIWINLTVSLVRHTDGQPNYFVSVIEDIQERKEAELALRRMTHQFEQLLSSELLGIMTCRLDGTVEQMNTALRRLLSLPENSSLAEVNWREMIAPNNLAEDEAILEQVREMGTTRPWETEFLQKDGHRIPVVMGLTVIDPGSRQCIGFVLDATHQKQTEANLRAAKHAAEKASAAKSQFLATMSHELRTPLNGVIGMTQLLMSTDLSPEQQQFARACHSSGNTLLALINDILDLSKVEAGRLELENQPFELGRLVTEVEESNRTALEAEGLQFHSKRQFPDHICVQGDRVRLLRVLMNLLGNAGKFTAEGTISLAIRLEELTQEKAMFCFSVRDTGIGIDADQQKHLFDAFTQVDSSITRRYGGSGLGLAICKRLVEAMGGEIGVESEPDVGSTFWFRVCLPLANVAVDDELAATEQTLAPLPGNNPECPPRVLIAEDNKVNQLFVESWLKRAGWECDVAETGQQTLEAVASSRYDLVLMDCRMPDMDGLTTTREIRSREASAALPSRTPIIALTANALKGDRERCLEAGMDDYLTKPFAPEALQKTIERVLENRASTASDTCSPSFTARKKQTTPVDLQVVLSQCHNDLEFAKAISTMFRETCEQRLRSMSTSLEGGDWAELSESAHALKGTSAQMGANLFHSLLIELEDAANSQDPATTRSLLKQARGEADACCRFLESALAEQGAP